MSERRSMCVVVREYREGEGGRERERERKKREGGRKENVLHLLVTSYGMH